MLGIDFSFRDSDAVFGKELLAKVGTDHRSMWIRSKIRENDLYFFQDGKLSQVLFLETLACFEERHFSAVVVLAFTFIERSIAGRFFSQGHGDPRNLTSENLLKKGSELGWLSKHEFEHLDQLRQIRNSLVHFRDPLHPERPEIRAVLSAKLPTELLESDAQTVLGAAIHVLSKSAI